MPGPTSHRGRCISGLPMLLLGSTLVGCTWVEPTPESERVRIVPADRVADCRRLGELTTYTKAEIAGVNRNSDKVQEELEALARNEAAEMDADTIVAATETSNGRQTYIVYRCVK